METKIDVTEKVDEQQEDISLSDSEVNEFVDFLSNEESYLDDGLGVFHTDNHSNW